MEHAKSIGYTATYDGKEKTITLVCYHDGTEPEFIIK
jgi:hypothetical protein